MTRNYIALDNGSGTLFPLNGENGVRLADVTGLGTDFSESYGEITDGFFMNTDRRGSQATIAGTMIFKGSSCKDDYADFADFVLNTESLTMIFSPDGATQYRRDILVKFLAKGEARWNLLQVSASFTCLTPWYTVTTLTGTGSVSVQFGGQLGTSVKITTTSALTNPVLTMTDADGEFQRLALTLSTTAGKTLEYSSHPYDSHIYYNGSDAIQYADLTDAIFGRSRKAFTISLTGASMTVEVKKWWRTV